MVIPAINPTGAAQDRGNAVGNALLRHIDTALQPCRNGGKGDATDGLWQYAKRSVAASPARNLLSCLWLSHFPKRGGERSEEHTSELQSLMRNSYAVFCLKKKTKNTTPSRKPRKQ